MKDILRNISLFFKDLFTPDDIDKELIKKLDHDPSKIPDDDFFGWFIRIDHEEILPAPTYPEMHTHRASRGSGEN